MNRMVLGKRKSDNDSFQAFVWGDGEDGALGLGDKR
jgi:hypothetical protein